MAKVNRKSYDASKDTSRNFEPIPRGWYIVQFEDVEDRESSKTPLNYTRVMCRVISGEHTNRVIFDNLMLSARVPDAQLSEGQRGIINRGTKIVDQIAAGMGMGDDEVDTDHFLGKTARIRVSIDKGSGEYGPSNRIEEADPQGTGAAQPETGGARNANDPDWL